MSNYYTRRAVMFAEELRDCHRALALDLSEWQRRHIRSQIEKADFLHKDALLDSRVNAGEYETAVAALGGTP